MASMQMKPRFDLEVIRPADLALARFGLENLAFYDCLVLGPAVLGVLEGVTLSECSFSAPKPESMFIQLPEDSQIVGVIPIRNLHFERCQFLNVAFAGNEHTRDAFVARLYEMLERSGQEGGAPDEAAAS